MINYVFLSIPCTTTYQGLKRKQKYPQDTLGLSSWIMKFPLVIYSINLKQKHVFYQGDVQIITASQIGLQQKWKYFVITNSNSKKYYCTSQMFYEKSSILKRNNSFSSLSQNYVQFYLPKCLIIISQLPYFKLHVNLLKVHRQLRKKTPSISCSINQQLYKIYLQLLKQKRQVQWQNIQVPQQSKIIQCPISLVFDYYVQCCNNHMFGQTLYLQKITNRQVLHLYKLNPQTIYQLSYYFHLPLSAKTLRIVFSSIFQQKQLIFVSSNQNLNVMLIQTLMQMILPFKWQYMYVPNLQYDMIQAAQQSFMPYIVGIQKKYLTFIDSSQRIIIDVDNDSCQINTTLNQLPAYYQNYFIITPNNKTYLQWQKQVRINSLYFILDLLSENRQYNQILTLNKQQKDRYIKNIKLSLQPFYQEFIKKSMIFNKFIQDKHQDMYKEISYLLALHPQDRKNTLLHRFSLLQNQALTPIRFDNQKCWIKFYQRYTSQKKKNRFQIASKSVSMVDMSKSAFLTNKVIPQPSNQIKILFNRSTVRL